MLIVPPTAWGARPATSSRTIPLPVQELWLHHTAGAASGPAGLRAIQRYHQDVKGWADIGYSWLYDPQLRTFYEGRGPGIQGAHTEGHNRSGHALAVMGDFSRTDPPAHVVADLASFCRWHTRYGPDRFTGGHRDVGDTTCPGDRLYRLIPAINQAAQEDDVPLTDDDIARIAGAVWDRKLLDGSTAGRRLAAVDQRTASLLSRAAIERTAAEVGCDPDVLLDALHRRLAE